MKEKRTSWHLPQNQKQGKFAHLFNEENFDALSANILPRKLLIPNTNTCNANCVFCAYQYSTDPKQHMPNEIFERAVSDFVAFHPESYVSITPIVGDPLVDPEFFTKIKTAKKLGVKTLQAYTNAILLEKSVEDILTSGLDHLEISLADFNATEYKSIYRVDKYEKVLQGLHSLLRAHSQLNSSLSIDINLRSRRDIEDIVQEQDFINKVAPFLSDRVTLSKLDYFDNWTGLITNDQLPVGMELWAPAKDIKNLPCTRLFDLQVLANGNVRLCGCRSGKSVNDDLIIGNIKEKNLRDIWFSKEAFDLRRGFFSNSLPDTCLKCSFYQEIGSKRFFIQDER